jgi:5-methylcytosine-specific restriction protein B
MTQPTVADVVAALSTSKNVLLYGPPGTGKTWLVSQVVAYVRQKSAAGGQPTLIMGAVEDQFGTAAGADTDLLPDAMDVEWVTFHQSYSYEEFILGRRPVPTDGALKLEPYFGLLMTIAVRVKSAGAPDACLLIIDELNRANTGQVFGEFITLLDPEYRETVRGEENPNALNIALPGLAYENGTSEPIKMLRGGGSFQLPEDWTFPEQVYVLATMNSVDKAALPLDSALTRRFHRIEMRPDPALLAEHLGTNLGEVAAHIQAVREGALPIDDLSAEDVAVLILDRLNNAISADMGDDFELGHSLLWRVGSVPIAARWTALFEAWDRSVFPQLAERYAGRIEPLKELLKVAPASATANAFHERLAIGGASPTEGTLVVQPLSRLPEDQARAVLRNLVL